MRDILLYVNIQNIIREIEDLTGKNALAPNLLLFLDEIQATPRVLPALRYFYEEFPQLPVIAAGSLLEFALSKHSFSRPVGRIEYLYLGPMTFEELMIFPNMSGKIIWFDCIECSTMCHLLSAKE